MHASSFLALAAATFAAAAPLDLTVAADTGSFAVTNFVFGCTVGCSWNFDVKVNGNFANHPNVPNPVHCEGSFDDTDYVECEHVSNTQSILAYIEKDNNSLKLQYVNQIPAETAVYKFYGNQTVYAATGENAALQQKEFTVPETSSTGVA